MSLFLSYGTGLMAAVLGVGGLLGVLVLVVLILAIIWFVRHL